MSRSFLVPILLPGDPTTALMAATKQYVDTRPAGDEVSISATDPGGTYELWVDTSTANMADPDVARWNSAWGIVGVGTFSVSGAPYTLPSGVITRVTNDIPITFMSGRRYRVAINIRAHVAAAYGGMEVRLHDGPSAQVALGTWAFVPTSAGSAYGNVSVEVLLPGDGVARLLNFQLYSPSQTVSIYLDSSNSFYVEDVGPVSLASSPPTQPSSVWTAVTFQNGWHNLGGGWAQAAYRLVGDRVELRGLIANSVAMTSGQMQTVFTVPAGFRPPADNIFSTNCAGPSGYGEAQTRVQAIADGTIQIACGNPTMQWPNTYTSLSGISFSVTP